MIETCKQIESALIGTLLVDPEKVIDIIDKVKATDFTDKKAIACFSAIIDDFKKGKQINILTISSRIPQLGMYMSTAISDAFPPSAVNFAEEIAYRAKTRRVKAGLEAASKADTPENMLSHAMSIFNHEMYSNTKDPGIKSVMSRVKGTIDKNKKKERVGYSTGFDIHSKIYYRYFPGHIWTIGGFTSVGKTAIMVQKICNMITGGEEPSILIISTEMSEEQIISRIVSNFTGIHSMRIMTGNYHNAEEEDRVMRIMQSLQEYPLRIYDEIYDLEDIETAFRRAKLQGGVNVGFIDYVQNCRWSKANSQYQEQATMAKRLQSLAKETKSTVVCLSQVSNDVGRGNTDQLELKGAGEWAAVSDFSVMLKRHPTINYKLKYIIKKNRHGALGEMKCSFMADFTKIREDED